MYVCVCNGLTSGQVTAAAAHCSSTGGVYRSLGVTPQCGKCIPTIRGMINAVQQRPTEELAPEPLRV
jgi:bacterioferritin-associated ferredoxin